VGLSFATFPSPLNINIMRQAPVTVERVARWYALLIDTGVADQIQAIITAIEEAKSQQKDKAKGKLKKTTIEEQIKESRDDEDDVEGVDIDELDVEFEINLVTMISSLAGGKLIELASIVTELEEDDKEEDILKMDMVQLTRFAVPFVVESMAPIKVLISTGGSMA
jgi:hypothetical protein